MTKSTLCLSLFLAGAASAFAAAPNALPELSTSRDDAKLYVISSYRGQHNATAPAILAGTQLEEKATTITGEVTEAAMWYVIEGTEEGTYFICNYGLYDEDYPEDQPALNAAFQVAINTEEATPYYILENGINEDGIVLSSSNPAAGTSCVDKYNSGVGLSGGWHPMAGDWEGTTWSFVAVDKDATSEENWATVAEAWNLLHAGPIKAAAIEKLEALVPATPWTAADFNAALESVNALENPTQDAVDEIINGAIASATTTLNKEIVGKLIALQNVRGANSDWESFFGATEVPMYGNNVDSTMVAGVGGFGEAYSYCYWNAVEAEGGFLLQNNATKAYIAKLPVLNTTVTTTDSADEAAVFTAGFFAAGANSGATFSSVVTPATEEAQAVVLALNGTNYKPRKLVTYYANDGGSTFIVTEGDASGIETIAPAQNANGAVEMFTISGVRVNPETAAPGLYIRRQGNVVTKILVR